MEPADYYRIDYQAIRALPRTDALAVLDQIRRDVTSETGAERARLVADEVEDQASAHGRHGAQRRAADALEMTPGRLGQLYTDSKEIAMTTLKIQWAPVPADHLADLMEGTHPDLAHRLRTREWVPMTQEEARAAVAATSHYDAVEGHREAHQAALMAVDTLEAEHRRQEHLARMRQIGVQGWIAERENHEDEGHPTHWAACVLGMDVAGQEVTEEEVRERATALGLPWHSWEATRRIARS